MMQQIEANWLVLGAVALLVLLVAWWLLARSKKPARREYRPDVLDEGVAPAQRNQALIDAPPAAAIDPVIPAPAAGVLGGVAEVVAIAAQDVVEEAEVARAAPPPPPPPPPAPETPPPPPEPEVEPAAPPAPEIEPAPPVPEVEPAPPAPEIAPPAPTPAAPEAPVADDLSRIKGLGPKLQALLPTLGITSYAQIAALTEADLATLDARLGPFAGRPAKDNWVEQAKYLATGDVAGFEALFGKV